MAAAWVLFVEDETEIRLTASEAPRNEGFDVLFTDVRMPGTLDGVDVSMHLRRQHPAIPVLIASGGAAHPASRLSGLSRLPSSSASLIDCARSWRR